jgi:hypothetical protein
MMSPGGVCALAESVPSLEFSQHLEQGLVKSINQNAIGAPGKFYANADG